MDNISTVRILSSLSSGIERKLDVRLLYIPMDFNDSPILSYLYYKCTFSPKKWGEISVRLKGRMLPQLWSVLPSSSRVGAWLTVLLRRRRERKREVRWWVVSHWHPVGACCSQFHRSQPVQGPKEQLSFPNPLLHHPWTVCQIFCWMHETSAC